MQTFDEFKTTFGEIPTILAMTSVVNDIGIDFKLDIPIFGNSRFLLRRCCIYLFLFRFNEYTAKFNFSINSTNSRPSFSSLPERRHVEES